MGIWFLTFRSPYRALHSKEGDSKNFVCDSVNPLMPALPSRYDSDRDVVVLVPRPDDVSCDCSDHCLFLVYSSCGEERWPVKRSHIDGEAGPPNSATVFLTKEDSEGSRAPMTRTQSPGLASAFNLMSN